MYKYNLRKTMKTRYISLLILISNLLSFACTFSNKADYQKFNLGFEKIENGFPTGWKLESNVSNYNVSVDSINVKSGKYSIIIESMSDSSNSVVELYFTLPENYQGKQIKLSGYVKTENVTGEVLLAVINYPFGSHILKDTIHGTSNWKKYEVTAQLRPDITKEIIIAEGVSGKGKIWLDDFKITIDGKDIRKAKPYNPDFFPANKDKEFDKGSNIVFSELNERTNNDLELLGKIWGFLKYYHHAFAKGDYNWDYELFRMLPSYLKVNNNEQRDWLLLKWINNYGKIPIRKNCQATSDNAFIKPDLTWIDKSNLNHELKELLHKIYLNRSQGNHYYIEMTQYIGNPIFTNERTYEIMDFPDAGFRLLALFRYWNMIQYFYPYKYLADKDWNQILKEYISRFIDAKNRLEYESATALLIGEVCDSHAYLQREEGLNAKGQVPALVRFIDNKLIVMEYWGEENTENSQLKKGDIIARIEGKPVEAIVDSMKQFYPASNNAARMRDIADNILRSDKNTINIDYKLDEKPKQKKINVGTRDKWMYHDGHH